MGTGRLSFDISNLQTTEDFVEEANKMFKAQVEEIKGSVYTKLAECEGELYELFKSQYDTIIQTALDTATGSIDTYKANLVSAEDTLKQATNDVKNIISG